MPSCDPNALMEVARCFRCLPRGSLLEVQVGLLCQWANGTTPTPPVGSGVVLSNGAGGFCRLVVDVTGNIGADVYPGPATSPVPVLADGSGGFWQIVTDGDCNRGMTSVAGPATAVPVLVDSNSVSWTLVVDSTGNLGAA